MVRGIASWRYGDHDRKIPAGVKSGGKAEPSENPVIPGRGKGRDPESVRDIQAKEGLDAGYDFVVEPRQIRVGRRWYGRSSSEPNCLYEKIQHLRKAQ